MNLQIERVKEFQQVFGHPITSDFITLDRRRLRLKLIFEELQELSEAYGLERTFEEDVEKFFLDLKVKKGAYFLEDTKELDTISCRDALGDLEVVLLGSVLETGVSDTFEKDFDAIMDSNMSKVCKTLDEAQATMAKYNLSGIDTYHKLSDDGKYYVIYNKETNKILKSLSYKKPIFE